MVSEAARQMPEEVYKNPVKGDAGKEEVQGRSERKRRRAASKRQFRKREGQVSSLQLLLKLQVERRP